MYGCFGRVRFRWAFLLLLVCLTAIGTWASPNQRYYISYAPNSQEGLLLQLIEQLDGPPKIEQMEAFAAKFPNHPSAGWVLSSLQTFFANTGASAKAIAMGEKLLNLYPQDLDAALLNQKMAVASGDPAQVKKWTAVALAAAKQLSSTPRPIFMSPEEWRGQLEAAGSILAHDDYDAYLRAVQQEKPGIRIKLMEEFLTTKPESFYADHLKPMLMRLYHQSGDHGKALTMADKILARNANDEEALLISAQILLDRRTNYSRVIGNANAILSLFSTAAKPQGANAAEWEKRRAYFVGVSYQLLGGAYVYQNMFKEAIGAFSAALPYLKGDVQTTAAALFYIGWSHYYLEDYKKAYSYYNQCLALQSPFSQQAKRQLDILASERRVVQD